MSFVNELKRRNVIRVGVLYLVSAWVLLQLTDVLTSLLASPPWAGSLVVLLLALGFFPVMIFSWVYEMTPEGLKRESEIDRALSITSGTGRKINTLIVVLLVLAIGGLIADRMVPESSLVADVADVEKGGANIAPDDRSIAVLPFADMSPEQDQQYFTDGLSEELLNLLVRVDDLQVASRTSSFAYRGSTLGIPEISRALNVGHILEGSVRKDGDRIRITAQLIETGSDRHVWSENFDRELNDIFAIQDEIANAIVQALTGEMGIGGDKAVTVEAATDNLDAYAMYLAARELFIKRETIDESIRLFRAAIELDPEFARAWEGLAAAEAVGNAWISGDGIDHGPRAKEAAEQALVLNPDLSMPFAVLGLHATNRHDMLGALDFYNLAIEKDAKNTSAWLWKGLLLKDVGYLDDAILSLEQCLTIDPGYQNCRQHMAVAYLNKGDVTRAVALNDETLEHIFHSISDAFVSTYVRSGHRILAAHVADAKLLHGNAPVMEWIRAIENPEADNSAGLVQLQDWAERTTTGIDLYWIPHVFLTFRAYDELLERPVDASWVLWHPDADEFRGTPQFKQIIREVGAFAYWQVHGFPPQCRAIGDDDFDCSGPSS